MDEDTEKIVSILNQNGLECIYYNGCEIIIFLHKNYIGTYWFDTKDIISNYLCEVNNYKVYSLIDFIRLIKLKCFY